MTQLPLFLGMLMLTANFSSTAQFAPPQAVVQAQLSTEEQRFVDLINYERWRGGLGHLTLDPVLLQAARDHSKEMADLDYFDHYSPTPGRRTAMERYLAARQSEPSWAYLGENLFYCSIVDVNRGHNRLMGSSGHRANILNARFERVGVGVYESADGQFWVTQMFLAQTD